MFFAVSHPTGIEELNCPKCACVIGMTNDCDKMYDIKIQYCPTPKDFYLYHLKPTSDITEGYCFGTYTLLVSVISRSIFCV